MPTLVIQAGHYGRTTGATGGPGERELMIRIARAAKTLVDDVDGWTARVIPADGGDYRGDAFIALHGDASNDRDAVGASVGFRTSDGDRLAQAWKSAYRSEVGDRIGPFRGDNYTAALAGYYGTRHAANAGNTRAAIVEHGFLTNPDERRWLESDEGIAAAARTIRTAVTGDAPPTPPGHATELPVARGDTGPLVTSVQQSLAGLGYELDVDGDYGPATEAAVTLFQSHADVPVDRFAGVWGPQTQAALDRATSEGHIMATLTEVAGIVRDEIAAATPAIADQVTKRTTRGSVTAGKSLNIMQYLDIILRLIVKDIDQSSQARAAAGNTLAIVKRGIDVDLSDDDIAEIRAAIADEVATANGREIAEAFADILRERLEN